MHWDIIVLHKCTKNHDHRLPCSWDMACDGCNCYFSFWAFFCPFTLLIAKKWKFQRNNKKKKQQLEISSFKTSVPKIMIMCFTVPEIWHVTDAIVIFHFGFFCLFSPLTARKIKISKKWKKNQHLEISSFNTCVPKIMICFTVPEIQCVTDILLFFILGYFALLPPNSPKKSKFQFQKNEKKTLDVSSFYTSVPKIMIIC